MVYGNKLWARVLRQEKILFKSISVPEQLGSRGINTAESLLGSAVVTAHPLPRSGFSFLPSSLGSCVKYFELKNVLLPGGSYK